MYSMILAEGQMKLNVTQAMTYTSDQVSAIAQDGHLMPGGVWSPTECKARRSLLIIVPYRNRNQHLLALLAHLHPILQRQQTDYRILVVEQVSEDHLWINYRIVCQSFCIGCQYRNGSRILVVNMGHNTQGAIGWWLQLLLVNEPRFTNLMVGSHSCESCFVILFCQARMELTLWLLVVLGVTHYYGLMLDDTPSARHHYLTWIIWYIILLNYLHPRWMSTLDFNLVVIFYPSRWGNLL